MNGDICILQRSTDSSLEKMLENSRLGTADEILLSLQGIFPDINVMDPKWLRLDGGDYYIEFDLGKEAEVNSLTVYIRGNAGALEAIRRLCEATGWAAYHRMRQGFLNFSSGEIEPLTMPEMVEINPQQASVQPRKKRGWFSWLTGSLFLLLGKLKTIFFAVFSLLKFSKFFGTGLSMIVMIVSYTVFYGWKYAIGIVLLLFLHEMGHVYFAQLKKMKVSLPLFIPFVGAFIRLKEEPSNAKIDAFVALGGPLFGVIGAVVCLAAAIAENSRLLAAIAYFGFFITVFNLIPAYPLDGGRIVTSLSPAFWIIGIVALGFLAIYYFNPIMLLVLVMAVARAWKAWKHRGEEKAYFAVDRAFRWKMGVAYFGLLGLSSSLVYWLHAILQLNSR